MECIKGYDKCPHLYRSNGREERIAISGALIRMKQECYYCMMHPELKKIGTHATWSSVTPCWCPMNKEDTDGTEKCHAQS